MKKRPVDFGHMLSGIRMDVWLKLLRENKVDKEFYPQAAVITLESAVLTPLAYLEYLLFWIPVHFTKIKKDPIYVIGFWRSGTTYLQNLLTRDPQFGWFDPVSTIMFGNCILLRKPLTALAKNGLKGARAMDNLEFELDLPMEEAHGFTNLTDLSVSHMMAFPDHGKGAKYVEAIFTDALSSKDRKRFWHVYNYMLKKLTYIKGGKQLLLKSPDNTARIAFLKRAYPKAKFINIYRNPYTVVRSALNMFRIEMDKYALSESVSDQYLLDRVCLIFERVYRRAFRDLDNLAPCDKIEIKYEDFVENQEEYLEKIYKQLGIKNYDKAYPYFKEYMDSMKDYKTNQYDYAPELIEKVNERLGFYFERYGYEMIRPERTEAVAKEQA
ncbi:putative uncharacterized protein [Clostridium sp. CAG:632]|nr:putative uncharacterized protein [Clostridium sp. CAG:632]